MPGTRFEGWHHTRFEGDPETAKQHMPLARKVLGAVAAEARASSVMTLKRVYRPEAGLEIIAEVHGEQPRVTIRTARAGDGQRGRLKVGDFVVTAKDSAQPEGIDALHPQQILKAEWTTFFYDQDVPGYDAFQGRKGTYRYGAGGVEQFPDGVRHAGNLDWRGADGERVSWYGPACRYWFDRWRQPSAQYSRYVFLLGQVLLDIDAYCDAAGIDFDERLVLGAALQDSSLLVVQAEIADVPPESVPVGRAGDVFLSTPYPTAAVPLRLVRYPLLVDGAEPETLRLFVDIGAHETLWIGSGVGWLCPWFFSQDAAVAESFAMPASPFFHQYVASGDTYDYQVPSAASERLALSITGETAVLDTQPCSLAMNQAEAFAPVAADYDYRGNRVLLEFGYRAFRPIPAYDEGEESQASFATLPWANYFLRANGREVPIFESLSTSDVTLVRWRRIATIDLRFRTFAFIQTEQGDDWQFTVALRIESRPDLTATCAPALAQKQVINGMPPLHTGWQALAWWSDTSFISPLAMLVGAVKVGIEGEFLGPGIYLDTGFNLMWYLPAADQLFGTQAFYDQDNGAILRSESQFQAIGYSTYWNDRPDTESMRNPLSLAVGQDHVVYSGPGWFQDYNAGDFLGFNYITGDSLGDLTGVSGGESSYHPIWVLGEIPPIAKD